MTRRGRRPPVPAGAGPGGRDPDPDPRRLRPGRGRRPGGVRRGARDLAGRGVPDNPGAWITTTARATARSTACAAQRALAEQDRGARRGSPRSRRSKETRGDVSSDPRRPAAADLHVLPPGARARGAVALTLQTLGGLTTRRDRARLPRRRADDGAAARPGEAQDPRRGIPYRVPPAELLPERLPRRPRRRSTCLQRGLLADRGRRSSAPISCDEAIRLARVAAALMPDEPEVAGPARADAAPATRAAMRAHRRRRRRSCCSRTRTARAGITPMIDEGSRSSTRRCAADRPGPYQLQAAIAAVHAAAAAAEDTDWPQIAALYAAAGRMTPSPGRRAQPRRRRRDGRRPRSRAAAGRRARGRARRLPPVPRRARGSAAPARPARRRPRPRTGARSSWPRTRPNALSSSAGSRRSALLDEIGHRRADGERAVVACERGARDERPVGVPVAEACVRAPGGLGVGGERHREADAGHPRSRARRPRATA